MDLSVKQNKELKAKVCKDGSSAACQDALREAAWYANKRESELFNEDDAKRERFNSAVAVGDTVFGGGYAGVNLKDAFSSLGDRQNLFGTVDLGLKYKGTEAEWFEKAEKISGGDSRSLTPFESKSNWFYNLLVPENKPWLKEAGDKILDIGYPDWKGLYNQPDPVTGSNASSWDKRFLIKEQTDLQPIHEKYIEPTWFSKFLLDKSISSWTTGWRDGKFLKQQDRIDYGCGEFSHKCK